MAGRICVFCGSSPGVREDYTRAARELARVLVARNVGTVYGGGNTGVMSAVANAAIEAGGEVIGVMPRAMVEKERAHRGITRLHVVASMHERKAMMSELSDAFIALPGGFGTIEEFCEVLTWSQLGFQRKPCGLLNIAGYFDRLLSFFDHAVDEQFIKPAHRQLLITSTEPGELVERLIAAKVPYVDKWLATADI